MTAADMPAVIGSDVPARPTIPAAWLQPGAPLNLDAKDAARYRWLRAGRYDIAFARSVLNDVPHGIDAAIDAAMSPVADPRQAQMGETK